MRRWSNLALLWLVPLAALTGFATFLFGSGGALTAAVVHGTAALAVVALVPWKSPGVRRGLARARPGRVTSTVLGIVVVMALVTGLLHVVGVLADGLPVTVLQVHVGAGLVAVALTTAHARDRRVRVRPGDLSRRTVLRAGGLAVAGAVGAGGVLALGAQVAGAGVRRATGSARLTGAAVDPVDAIPATSWLFDRWPEVDRATWRLTTTAGGATRDWNLAELAAWDDEVTTVLDCTGGWWTQQTWRGVRLARLFPPGYAGSLDSSAPTSGSSLTLRVESATGYARRLPLTADLLLATSLAGRPLRLGHGAPVRLVVPGRRGYHWVKWVTKIEVVDGPWWAQPPLPLR